MLVGGLSVADATALGLVTSGDERVLRRVLLDPPGEPSADAGAVR